MTRKQKNDALAVAGILLAAFVAFKLAAPFFKGAADYAKKANYVKTEEARRIAERKASEAPGWRGPDSIRPSK